ncbi:MULTISPECIES: invasion associated locus B family protein [Roseobacteraceae]|jgi:invasion protein IalB|uniref:Invasion associated locus B (IalB) protein n=1 Tax=Pseudosulfitobacter pseudonitzschiae TaxID=1402135 RepID=A0A221K0L5_9RHOB|nr:MULTISPECIES: invasion associated locus B family protein [Roseobacteraceae]ASM72367.1 invasion associated locus B (IalB) protein [Pseudosulfitobacter pseudonitzschiae]
MSYTIKTLVLTAALAMSAPVAILAQETTTEGETPNVETQSGSASEIESQLSLGADADADPELGKPYTAETVGAFEMRCIKTEEEKDPCQMYQLLDDGEGVPVAEFSLFRLPEGGKAVAGATLVVPLETSLPAQMKISVDGGPARTYPYAFCNPVGCYARIGLVEQDVAAFRRGAKATITIVPALAPDQKVELDLSLKGFTDGFDKASVIEQ